MTYIQVLILAFVIFLFVYAIVDRICGYEQSKNEFNSVIKGYTEWKKEYDKSRAETTGERNEEE